MLDNGLIQVYMSKCIGMQQISQSAYPERRQELCYIDLQDDEQNYVAELNTELAPTMKCS